MLETRDSISPELLYCPVCSLYSWRAVGPMPQQYSTVEYYTVVGAVGRYDSTVQYCRVDPRKESIAAASSASVSRELIRMQYGLWRRGWGGVGGGWGGMQALLSIPLFLDLPYCSPILTPQKRFCLAGAQAATTHLRQRSFHRCKSWIARTRFGCCTELDWTGTPWLG